MCPRGVSRSTRELESGKAKIWILLIGIDKYQDESINNLKYCRNDCQELGQALKAATQRFPVKEIILHHDLTPQPPVLQEVRQSLEKFRSAQPKDTVLFYFSGHGFLDPHTQQPILCLADTRKKNLAKTGLQVKELLNELVTCKAQHQIVWLDACHSGGMKFKELVVQQKGELKAEASENNSTSQLMEILRQRAKQSKGFYAMLSCDREEKSLEFPDLGHGLFTYYLIKGLRGEAADSKGIIEADRLYKYVYHRTLQHIDKSNQQIRVFNQQQRSRGAKEKKEEYSWQTPGRIVEGAGEFVLGLSPKKEPRQSLRQALVINGLSGFETTITLSKILRTQGGFEVDYYPKKGKDWSEVKDAISACLDSDTSTTVLLYLRGRIEVTAEGIYWLVLGDELRLSRDWLSEQLHSSQIDQKIIILDFPGATNIGRWVKPLQLGIEQSQCLIAASKLSSSSAEFSEKLVEVLTADGLREGLTVAGLITQLQRSLRAEKIDFYPWLSGITGLMEVILPEFGNSDSTVFDAGICPYMGLNAFTKKDAFFFHGREALKQEIIKKLETTSFQAVVGASGSGKSSVVQAGVLPLLETKGLFCPEDKELKRCWTRSFCPGRNPLASLASALSDTKEKRVDLEGLLNLGIDSFVFWLRQRPEPMVVLVIDQFEELFTLISQGERQKFLKLMLGAIDNAGDRFKLIITLRSDFISSCLEIPDLATLVKKSNILVPSQLNEEEYREIIVKPAQKVGLSVNSALIDVLLEEIKDSAGSLPLLEFILEQLWQYRSEGSLTLQVYQEQIGGLRGVLEKKANQAYEGLNAKQKKCAKWIFLSLVHLGEGKEDTRRRISKSELVAPKYDENLVRSTLQKLIAAKLIVVSPLDEGLGARYSAYGRRSLLALREANSRGSEDSASPQEEEALTSEVSIEIVHEILIRNWSQLRWWLDENRQHLRLMREIEQDAAKWRRNKQKTDYLLRGAALAQAEKLYYQYTDELSWELCKFINGGLEERDRLYLQEKLRRERELKRERKARKAAQRTTVGAILGIIILFGVSIFAGIQWRSSEIEEIRTLSNSSEVFVSDSQILDGRIASLQAARKLKQSFWQLILPDAELNNKVTNALVQAIYGGEYIFQKYNRIESNNGPVEWSRDLLEWSPDGKILAFASGDKTVKLWQPDGTLKTLKGHSHPIVGVSWNRNSILATADNKGNIILWNRDGNKKNSFSIPSQPDKIYGVSWSPDGQRFAIPALSGTVYVWQQSDNQWKEIKGDQSILAVNWSPDGTLTAGTEDGNIKLWRQDSSEPKILGNHPRWVVSVSWSPDGTILASVTDINKIVRLYKNGELLRTLEHPNPVMSVSWSPDGILASGSEDKTIHLWKSDGTLLATLKANGSVHSLSWSPDGQVLAAESQDGTVELWRTNPLLTSLTGHTNKVNSISWSPDGELLASGSQDKTVRLWHSDGTLYATLNNDIREVESVSWSPDGILAAAAYERVHLWTRDEKDNQFFNYKTLDHSKHRGRVYPNPVKQVSWSSDGKELASASWDATLQLWDRNGNWQKTLNHSDWVEGVSWSSKQRFASAGKDGNIKIFNSDGTELKSFYGKGKEVYSVNWSPDGKILASANGDYTVRLWDENGNFLQELKGHEDDVVSVSWRPDGAILASASADGTVKLWRQDGTLLITLKGHIKSINEVNWSPDGQILATASSDNTVKLWRLNVNLEDKEQLLNDLLVYDCNWMSEYFKTHPSETESDRRFCAQISPDSHEDSILTTPPHE